MTTAAAVVRQTKLLVSVRGKYSLTADHGDRELCSGILVEVTAEERAGNTLCHVPLWDIDLWLPTNFL